MSRNEYLMRCVFVMAIAILIGCCVSLKTFAEEKPIAIIYQDKIEQETDEHITSNADFIEEVKNPYGEILSKITPAEEAMLCSCTWYEANNQNMIGQRAVIEVILNRVLSDRFPNTIAGVIFQRGQFATARAVKNKGHYTDEQLDALQLVSEEAPVLPDVSYVYFDTRGINGRDKIKIQDHWFGRLKK